MLDGFQAGLAWIHHPAQARRPFRAAFANFDPDVVARYGAADRARLMAGRGHRPLQPTQDRRGDLRRARSTIWTCASADEDFADFLWAFTDGKPIVNHWTNIGEVPAQTPLAADMAKALKAKGVQFCGPGDRLRLHAGDRHGQRPYDRLFPAWRRLGHMGGAMMSAGRAASDAGTACPSPVCGVDEAGRPWAGPVSAAAVILDPDRVPDGINDSQAADSPERASGWKRRSRPQPSAPGPSASPASRKRSPR